MYLLIDNYDSFTYNLVQVLQTLHTSPTVLRHDHQDLLQLASSNELRAVIISPGPGGPEDAGKCLSFLAALPRTIPVLGVCLGHQILAHFAGYPVVRAKRIMHGKTSPISHCGEDLFHLLPQPFTATRYHSLIMDETPISGQIAVHITARSEHGEPMALAYADRPWMGIQFHPESILTREGPQLLENFLRLAAGHSQKVTNPQGAAPSAPDPAADISCTQLATKTSNLRFENLDQNIQL